MRIGYFGGSFDPVHLGHTSLAKEILAAARLDLVVYLPAGRPPHKRGRPLAPAADRIRMLDLAIGGDPRFAVDGRETLTPEPSYTFATMERLRRERPQDELFFLIGMDSLRDLPSWHRIADLAKIVTFLVAARPGYDPEIAGVAARKVPGLAFQVIPTAPVDASSTAIRNGAAQGVDVSPLTGRAVADYIRVRGLYRDAAAM